MHYGQNEKLDRAVEDWIHRHVGHCQSALVDALIQADFDGFGIGDIQGIYADTSECEVDQVYEYADNNGIELEHDPRKMSRAELLEEEYGDNDGHPDETDEDLRERIAESYLDEWKDRIVDFSADNPNEPLEWWVVDSWLCEKLLEIGEVVIDNDYGYWWGRTCSGQGVSQDGTFYRLFEHMGWDKEYVQ